MIYAWWRYKGNSIGRPLRFRGYLSRFEAERRHPPATLGIRLVAIALTPDTSTKPHRVHPDPGAIAGELRAWSARARVSGDEVEVYASGPIPEALIFEDP